MNKDINCMSGRCRFASRIYLGVVAKYGEPDSVIELGCGNGLNLKQFSKASRRVGIDPFQPNIVAANKNVPEVEIIHGCHLKLKDFEKNEFDLGITCSVLNHIEHYELALDELFRICKKLYLVEPTIEGENRPALASETSSPNDTWYFDYRSALTKRGLDFSIKHTPLYKKNSGSLYHVICVDCE